MGNAGDTADISNVPKPQGHSGSTNPPPPKPAPKDDPQPPPGQIAGGTVDIGKK